MKLFTTAVLTSLSLSVAADTFTAAQDPWPPFILKDGQTGLATEVVKAAFKSEGHSVDLKILPWARALDGVKKGSIDMLIATWHTKERTAYLRYSNPYAQNNIKFIKRKGDTYEFNGLDSLSGLKVGILRGYGYNSDFLNASNFTRPETSDFIANIKKVIAKRIDLTLEDEIVGKALLSKHPDLSSKIEFTSNGLSTNDVHVSSGIANSKSQNIVNIFNSGLEKIKADGTYDAIFKKYGIEL